MGDTRALALFASLVTGVAASCGPATPPPTGPTQPAQPDAGLVEQPDGGAQVALPPAKPCTSIDECRAACRDRVALGCLRVALIATSFPEEEHLLTDEAAALRRSCE